jgi:hypothetical protein
VPTGLRSRLPPGPCRRCAAGENEPRRISTRRHIRLTRVCRRGTSKALRDWSMGALYKLQVRSEAFPRSETRQELEASNMRFTPHERLLYKKTPQGGGIARRSKPIAAWRLHVQLRLTAGRILRPWVAPKFRDYFTVNVLGQLHRLAGLPMEWSLSHLSTFVASRRPLFATFGQRTQQAPPRPLASTRDTTSREWKGAKVFLYVDDFMFFASCEQESLMSASASTSSSTGSDYFASQPPRDFGRQHSLITLSVSTSTRRRVCFSPPRISCRKQAHARYMIGRATKTRSS